MTSSLESRKLKIINALVELRDEHVIQLIEALLHSEQDFWEALTDDQKARIERSIREVEAGKGVPHESVVQEFRKKYGAGVCRLCGRLWLSRSMPISWHISKCIMGRTLH